MNCSLSKYNVYLLISLIALALIFLASCDPNRVYEKNKDIPDYKWHYDNMVEFPVEIQDTNALYNIYVNVRHTHFFPFRNLWVKVHTEFPEDKEMSQRVEIKLADKNGKWFSDCAGDICDYKARIQSNAYFNQKGTYHFALEQNMRQNPLPGIMDIGLRVEKTLNKGSKTWMTKHSKVETYPKVLIV